MKIYVFLLLTSVISVNSVEYDWDARTDRNFERQNELTRYKKATTLEYPGGEINGITYSKAIMVGLDSVRRTGHCTMREENNCKTFDTHYGLGLAAVIFPKLTLNGETMSAYIKAANNSVHYRLTNCRNPCSIKVELLQLESLGPIFFGASKEEFDGMDLNGMFYRVVMPHFQKRMDAFRRILEAEININICARHVSLDHGIPLGIF